MAGVGDAVVATPLDPADSAVAAVLSAHLGERLALLKDFAMGAPPRGPVGDVARSHMLNMAETCLVLCRELALSDVAVAEAQRTQQCVLALTKAPKGARNWKEHVDAVMESTTALEKAVIAELEIASRSLCSDLFGMAFNTRTMATLLKVKLEGKKHPEQELQRFILHPLFRPIVEAGLEEIAQLCSRLASPPTALRRAQPLLQALGSGRISTEDALELQQLASGAWPDALVRYLDQLAISQLQRTCVRSGVSAVQVPADVFRLGELIGNMHVLSHAVVRFTDRRTSWRDFVYYATRMCERLGLPVDMALLLRSFHARKSGTPGDALVAGFAIDPYYYQVVARVEDLLTCLYAPSIGSLFTIGHYVGYFQPLLTGAGNPEDENEMRAADEMYLSPGFRGLVADILLSGVRGRLRALPLSDSLRREVEAAFVLWESGDTPPETIHELRAYLARTLGDQVVGDMTTVIGDTMVRNADVPGNPYVEAFLKDHPDYNRNVFVIMRYRKDRQYQAVLRAIRDTLREFGLRAHRADDKQYAADLWTNVCTYMRGCRYAIVVFEEIDERDFNPNVSMELGYMMALEKHCLILKDQRMPSLPTDVVGQLYRQFDTYRIRATVSAELRRWLADLGIGRELG